MVASVGETMRAASSTRGPVGGLEGHKAHITSAPPAAASSISYCYSNKPQAPKADTLKPLGSESTVNVNTAPASVLPKSDPSLNHTAAIDQDGSSGASYHTSSRNQATVGQRIPAHRRCTRNEAAPPATFPCGNLVAKTWTLDGCWGQSSNT